MTVPELLGALAILCGLLGFGFHVWADIRREARRAWRHEWPITHTRPFDREKDAA